LAFSSFQAKEKKTQRKKNHREEKICREGKELTFKLPLYPLTFGSCFCPLAFALPFQTFFLGIFFFSSRRKDKKHKEKKNRRKEKKCRERRELTFKLSLYPLIFGSCFYPLAFALSFQVLSPNIFFFSNRNKEKKKEKDLKNKKCKEGMELTFLLLLLHLG